MGGNACKEWGVRRLNADAYYFAEQGVLDFLRTNFRNARFDAVKAYASKKTFGDMDIVYSCSDRTNVVDGVKKIYQPIGWKKNGDCFSWVCETFGGPFQVDLLRVAPEEHEFALNYFNYNDLGNLLGRVYHKAGFKLGYNGLRYVVRDPENADHVVDELIVTLSWQDAMDFMGYDHYRDVEFNTPEALFKFTVSSVYSNRDIYLLENRNAKSRMRDRKRATYTAFLRWLDANPDCCSKFDWSKKDELRAMFLEKALNEYPKFAREYAAVMEKLSEDKLFRMKFNGDLVMKWTGLEGKELGEFMRSVRERFGDRLRDFVLSSEQDEIEKAVKNFTE